MKALSVKQPFAGLISIQEKLIETRTWSTKYRGDILICSSLKPMKHLDSIATHAVLTNKFKGNNGIALCVAKLVDVIPMTEEHQMHACCEIYPGAYSWILKNIRPIKPFKVKGQLSLFEVDDSLIEYYNIQGFTYNERCNYQLDQWVLGNPIHNDVDNECCPDFSCCNPENIADEQTRKLFKAANQEQRESFLYMFLGNALANYVSEKKIFVCNGKDELNINQN